ncbi:MAG: hypothetical protein R6V86_00675 [Spirochaetia bacterium]
MHHRDEDRREKAAHCPEHRPAYPVAYSIMKHRHGSYTGHTEGEMCNVHEEDEVVHG